MGKKQSEWKRFGKGLQYRNHPTKKNGVKFDKYCRGRYKIDGETTTVSFGWESEWVAAEKARMEKEDQRGPRKSFLDHCTGELSRLKGNARKGVGPTTIKEDRKIGEIKKQEAERAKAQDEKASLTFSELFNDYYLPFVRAEGKKSWKQEVSLYNTWIVSSLGGKKVVEISPIDVERVKHRVSKERSERTVQYCLAIIRRVYNFAIMRDFFQGLNPTKKVKIPSPDNGRVSFFTRKQADTLLSKLQEKSPQLSQMTEVSLFSGLRWGEVAGLLWPDVNIDQKTIFVRDPKNKHSRTVPMPERLQKMFQSIYEEGVSGYVFPSKKGTKSEWVSRTVKRVIDDMGVNDNITDSRQKLTFHSCRHSFCSWLAMEGVPLHTIGQLAGHRTLKMTMRYSHLLPDTLQAAVSLLDKPEDVTADVIPLETNKK